jgi:hypothetical protein
MRKLAITSRFTPDVTGSFGMIPHAISPQLAQAPTKLSELQAGVLWGRGQQRMAARAVVRYVTDRAGGLGSVRLSFLRKHGGRR